ncbi:MAG TPA: Holliday junction branch migration protein RuvA [Gordonia sp. (in: high G+C Gram-positive bacteria)]|uniref:Holliday junction branch migration protein RuvA n=1 Tax=unclassified Gordonia (in: high G+C Gram-positive bacteria) TaxID=2657482 RepID=UPI000FBB539C|nr:MULTISPECIES: Holliday junction branch migration protein RuvA [unclassified Gordonia (in: high G+C Gram-positive bacteria)]RUP35762.1 MAG: Holliday junction branch migration protein RuvA [Gordonia sp. (in: high G+C Gram-positive bacteria)]HNP57754.1 Holliday junction branch migration protein RuvA [Gordonia sp. (in: high G+C Gram-positive bacteria)]HRC50444.1 Holliday junction branch migration protein RuvA [Gordonia sp. (in: high G+C Gram-positive bacteria)]
MIAAVRGPVIDVALDHVVVDCAGVGYRVLATPATIATLTRGIEATLLTTMIVREDSMTLYGFTDGAARDLFVLLQTVTGVGPRLAMAALAVHEPAELAAALASSNITALTAVPGIGKRVAERLTVELRDKVGVVSGGAASSLSGGATVGGEVTEALVGLGFPAAAAEKAVAAVLAENPDADASAALRAGLSLLGKK